MFLCCPECPCTLLMLVTLVFHILLHVLYQLGDSSDVTNVEEDFQDSHQEGGQNSHCLRVPVDVVAI